MTRISQLHTKTCKTSRSTITGKIAWQSNVQRPTTDDPRWKIMIWHHDHPMLTIAIDEYGNYTIFHLSLGHGSISDQNGMNTIFRQLGLRLRMDRDQRGGGPRYTVLDVETQLGLNRAMQTGYRRFEPGGPPLVDPELDPMEQWKGNSLR